MVYYKSWTWMFRPFWVGFPYSTTFWGDQPAEIGRYKLLRFMKIFYLLIYLKFKSHVGKYSIPASSKWPFDHPNGGHQQPLKGSLKTPKKVTNGRTWYMEHLGLVVDFDLSFNDFSTLEAKLWRRFWENTLDEKCFGGPLHTEPQEVFGCAVHIYIYT